jgi:hypothetical protein
MNSFQPKGSRALRVIVAEAAARASYGDVLTFGELASALDVTDDQAGRAQVRQAVSAARPVLLRDHNRALVAVRGKGYRVALPGEFAGLAQDFRRKSDRAISKSLAHIDHAPVTDMSADELRRFQAVAVVVRNLHHRMTSAEQRLADLEEVVDNLLHPPQKVIHGTIENA